ncbi:MAG: VOC family protein [Gemmatimonadetes bacterium]|nr:VOC family protein [Gemmatimonadota bacterium]MBT6144295.1 VOC family protein [Gemmatimonadota bacterium]MBT7859010.1 VOC family protein [Gemmatimonadota bacterium]
MTATFTRAAPYKDDILSLPVESVGEAIPYYEQIMGFSVISRSADPHQSAVLERDGIQMGLAENGGDPSQEGAFFEVDDVEAAFEELRANGFDKQDPGYRVDEHGDKSFRVFFVVAPDGLCYCIGEDVTSPK